jgi:hypothetical protein
MTNPPYLAWCIPRRPMWKHTEHIRCRGLAGCVRAGWLRAAAGDGRTIQRGQLHASGASAAGMVRVWYCSWDGPAETLVKGLGTADSCALESLRQGL